MPLLTLSGIGLIAKYPAVMKSTTEYNTPIFYASIGVRRLSLRAENSTYILNRK